MNVMYCFFIRFKHQFNNVSIYKYHIMTAVA